MKIKYILPGLLIGGLLGFGLTRYFDHRNLSKPSGKPVVAGSQTSTAPDTAKWNWADSMDAVKAAPGSHNIVYEDGNIRVLRVVLEPNKTEPVHTHQWKSIMWFTQATPMTYYRYGLVKNRYVVQDSMAIPQIPQQYLNHADPLGAEEPHAIKNLSSKEGIAYRVEFKKPFQHN